jgi:hypothetical protein
MSKKTKKRQVAVGKASHDIRVTAKRLEIRAGCLTRAWQMDSTGVTTVSISVGDHSVPLARSERRSHECSYDGLTRLSLYRGTKNRPIEFPPLQLHDVSGPTHMAGTCCEADGHGIRLCWKEPRQGVTLARSWIVHPDSDAIAGTAEISSESVPQLEFGMEWSHCLNVLETLPVNLIGWRVRVISLHTRTDYGNDLVEEDTFVVRKNSAVRELRGQLLFLEPPGGGWGLFILGDSPAPAEKRCECRADFVVGPDGVQVLGWGIAPHEILPDRLRSSYMVAVGGYAGGELERLCAVRGFIKARYPSNPSLRIVVANPWGDGSCYRNLCESFVLEELEACAALGITHYQIDDGWEAGGVLRDMTVGNFARPPDYWNINPEKFPRGFAPLAKRAHELGVNLSLWFAPDSNRQYRNWREDRDLLLRMYRQYGIRLFKIDNVWNRSKEGEENLMQLLDSVSLESHGEVTFNLDVTAGCRPGYLPMLRYGNVFVENRYVRPSSIPLEPNSYLPWRVLRNAWRLSRYLPLERLQFEIPNCHQPCFRTDGQIAKAFNMAKFSDEYVAAIALVASPLCWCEPSRLPPATQSAYRKILRLHHQIAPDLAQAHILPVGEEPNGKSWTGFQILLPEQPGCGLLLCFRENTDRDHFYFRLWNSGTEGGTQYECLSHPEPLRRERTANRAGIHIAQPSDFRLYRYAPAVGMKKCVEL